MHFRFELAFEGFNFNLGKISERGKYSESHIRKRAEFLYNNEDYSPDARWLPTP